MSQFYLSASSSPPPSITGVMVQYANSQTSSTLTGSTVFPSLDSGIPINTDGNQYFSINFTPLNATNTIILKCSINATTYNTFSGGAGGWGLALFQSGSANSICAVQTSASGGYEANQTIDTNLSTTFVLSAGSTSARTYTLRAGWIDEGAGTFAFVLNGYNPDNPPSGIVPLFGGVSNSILEIYEIGLSS